MFTPVIFYLRGRGNPSSRTPIFSVCWQSQATAAILGAGKLPQTRNIGRDEDLELQGERGPVKSRNKFPRPFRAIFRRLTMPISMPGWTGDCVN